VGRDQVQHIEMARDMAASFNHLYGEHFVLPEAQIEEHVATLPGLDGRKMSKSYDNTIPLFAPREQLRKLVASIVTDSRAPGEPKEVEGSALLQIYQAFASPAETEALRQAYAQGVAWGEVKQLVFEHIDQTLTPLRARYEALIQDPAHIENTLRAGAERARALATPFLRELRHAVGLRSLAQGPAKQTEKLAKPGKSALPSFKQYREADGQFYFKLVSPQGRLLLQSTAFESPRAAGQAIAQLQQQGAQTLHALAAQLAPVEGVTEAEVAAALQALQEAAPQT